MTLIIRLTWFSILLAASSVALNLKAESPIPVRAALHYSTTADGDSFGIQSDDSGNQVLFMSSADDLAPGDRNHGAADIFLKNMTSGAVSLISVNHAGTGSGNADSYEALMAADGGTVVFTSIASDLVPGDDNGLRDIFMRDLNLQETQRVTGAVEGGPANGGSDLLGMSDDGRFVLFQSEATNLTASAPEASPGLFLYDSQTGDSTLIASHPFHRQDAGVGAVPPAISADGKHVFMFKPSEMEAPEGYEALYDLMLYNISASQWSSIQWDDLVVDSIPEEVFNDFLDAEFSGDGNSLAFIIAVYPANLTYLVKQDLEGGQRIHRELEGNWRGGWGEKASAFSLSHDGSIVNLNYLVWDTINDTNHQLGIELPDAPVGGFLLSPFGESVLKQLRQQYDRPQEETTFPHVKEILSICDVESGEESELLSVIYHDNMAMVYVMGSVLYDAHHHYPDPFFSGEGGYLFFHSAGDHLVEHDYNQAIDLFRYDRESGEVDLVSSLSQALPSRGIPALHAETEESDMPGQWVYKNSLNRETWSPLPASALKDLESGGQLDLSARHLRHRIYQIQPDPNP